MKTNLLLVAAFIATSFSAIAGDPAPAKNLAVVSIRGTDVFKIIYEGQSAGKVKLNIYNNESELVYSESFKSTEGFIRPVNFAALTAGEYTVELIDNSGKKTEATLLNKVVSKKAAAVANVE